MISELLSTRWLSTDPDRAKNLWWGCIFFACLLALWLVVLGWKGAAALLLAPLLWAVIRNLQVALFGAVAFLPYIGDRDVSTSLLSLIWWFPFSIAAISWFVKLLSQPGGVHFHPALLPVFGTGLAVAVLSMLQGFDLNSVPDSLDPFNRVWAYFGASFYFLLGMAAAANEQALRRLFFVLLITGAPYALLLPFFNKEAEAGGRSFGIFTANSGAALHMQICGLAALGLVRGSPRFFTRIVLLLTAFAYFGTQVFTISKTALASIPVLAALWLLMEFGLRRTAWISLSLALLLAVSYPVLPQKIQKQLATIASSAISSDETKQLRSGDGKADISTYQQRLVHYERARTLIRDRPWFGYGVGTNPWISNLPYTVAGPWIHSYYYALAVDTGLLGLGVRLVLLAMVLAIGWRAQLQASRAGWIGLQDLSAALILILVSCLIMFLMIPGSESAERHSWFFSGVIASLPGLFAPGNGRGWSFRGPKSDVC